MSSKSKTSPPTDNVIIIDPENDEISTSTDTPTNQQNMTETSEQILETLKNEILKAKEGKEKYRYTPEQKAAIIEWIDDYGNGGQSKLVNAFRKSGINLTPAGINGWKPKDGETPKATRQPRTPKEAVAVVQSEKPEIALLKILKNRGFEVRVSVDALDPQASPEIHVEKKIEPIMEFVPFYNNNGRFEIGIDQLLTMLKLPLSK